MGGHWSKLGNELQSFSCKCKYKRFYFNIHLLFYSVNSSQTTNLSTKSDDKNLAKIQKLILQQYPYLENVKESMLVTDCCLPDCPIIYANDFFEKMTLYPKVKIILIRNYNFE